MSDNRPDPPGSDPRGVRFAAAITTVVLALVLLVTGSVWLLAAQAAVFALAAFAACASRPTRVLFRLLVAPRLGPPTAREDAAPVRFSQAVGLVFAAVGALGYARRAHRARHHRPPRSRWPPPSSTPPSASAWAASCTALIARSPNDVTPEGATA